MLEEEDKKIISDAIGLFHIKPASSSAIIFNYVSNLRNEIAELEALLQGAISEAEFKEYKRRTERAEK